MLKPLLFLLILMTCAANATDIDNARALSEIIKQMIPLATEIQTKRINTPTYESQLQFLKENVTEVNLDKTYFKQKMVDIIYHFKILYCKIKNKFQS